MAKKAGVTIKDDVQFRVWDDDFYEQRYPRDTYAIYGNKFDRVGDVHIRWEDLLSNGKMMVTIRRSVLESDQKIIAVIAHEMYEVNQLREILFYRHSISTEELANLTKAGIPKNLHDFAWDDANCRLDKLYGAP